MYMDLQFPAPVGRIHRSSGATNLTQHNDRKAFLRRLWKQERVDLLLAYTRQEITLIELLDADRRGQLNGTLGDLALRRPLWATVDAMLPKMGRSAQTRARYKRSFGRLKRLGVVDDDALVSELTSIPWRELLAEWETSPSDWMHLRRALSSFMTVLLGDVYHASRRSLIKLIPTVSEREREPDLPIVTFLSIVAEARPFVQPAFMTMAFTGLRVGEFLDLDHFRLKPNCFGVEVRGMTSKKKSRVVPVDEELWPWILAGVPSPLRYKALRLEWVAACKAAGVVAGLEGFTLHDIRHCRAQWAHDAGSSLASIQQILGHRNIGQTARYARRKLKAEDAQSFGRLMSPHLNGRKVGT